MVIYYYVEQFAESCVPFPSYHNAKFKKKIQNYVNWICFFYSEFSKLSRKNCEISHDFSYFLANFEISYYFPVHKLWNSEKLWFTLCIATLLKIKQIYTNFWHAKSPHEKWSRLLESTPKYSISIIFISGNIFPMEHLL